MRNGENHPSDQDLLMAADGELAGRRARRARRALAHLAQCSSCRQRSLRLADAMAEFRAASAANLPSIAGPRALLRARLVEQQEHRSGYRLGLRAARSAALSLVPIGLALAIAVAVRQWYPLPERPGIGAAVEVIPNPALTPGAVRDASLAELCEIPHEEVVAGVPEPLRKEVFQEYGITHPHAGDYEIDYLIAPGLGGTDNIHNLWPEPYRSRWNARVKDALEERLHALVCEHQLNLDTARREISQDWIGAYRKYIRTN